MSARYLRQPSLIDCLALKQTKVEGKGDIVTNSWRLPGTGVQDDTKLKGTSGSEPACWPEFAQILSDLRVDRDTGERGWALQPGCLVGPPWASQQKDD